MIEDVQRLSAFSQDGLGGNPAGVLLCNDLPHVEDMQAIAKQVGYSETAFASRCGDHWRVRYFAPQTEIPFCGHATIALGAVLASKFGNGVYQLQLNDAKISVEGACEGDVFSAALQSPNTSSQATSEQQLSNALSLFDLPADALDSRIPPAIINAGANHLLLALKSRATLAAMQYDLDKGKIFMRENDLATISLVFAETAQLFHARNPFASGGVYEDPATGAAAAALAGYLRDLNWPHDGSITVLQGEDMGMPSKLHTTIGAEKGQSIRVSGQVRFIKD